MNVTLVPIEQVFPRDRLQRRVFDGACVRAVGSIDQLCRLPSGDSSRVIVPSRDAGGHELFGEQDLFAAEFRLFQKFKDYIKYVVEITLQAGPADRR